MFRTISPGPVLSKISGIAAHSEKRYNPQSSIIQCNLADSVKFTILNRSEQVPLEPDLAVRWSGWFVFRYVWPRVFGIYSHSEMLLVWGSKPAKLLLLNQSFIVNREIVVWVSILLVARSFLF